MSTDRGREVGQSALTEPARDTPEDAPGVGGGMAAPSSDDLGSWNSPWLFRVGFYGAILLLVGLVLAGDLQSEVVGGLCVVLVLILLLMKVPVAIAMGAPGIFGIWHLSGLRPLAGSMRDLPYQSTASWSLSVLPMFIFMGLLLWRSGATERLYLAARQWTGWLPGGLAVGTNFAGAGLAAVSGSTLGVTYALGRIGIPEMLRAGYDRRLATATILMAGTGGQLIPPSILLVVYAGVVAVPVGPQLLAGFVPGVILALMYGLLIVGLSVAVPSWAGRRGDVKARIESTWRERWRSLARVWPIPLLMIAVVGGLYLGVFTATEAGAFGGFGAVLIAGWFLSWRGFLRSLGDALGDTVSTTAAIFLLLIGAMLLNRMLALSGSARWVATGIDALGFGRVEFLLTMLLVYLVLGMFMDPLTMILVTVPILMPTIAALDISLIWFGVFVVLLGEVSIITPPVGILTFIVHRIAQEPDVNLGHRIRLSDVFFGVLIFLPVTVLVLLMLIWFPQLAEWLPGR